MQLSAIPSPPASGSSSWQKRSLIGRWRALGGGSLVVSIAIHALVLVVAGLVVFVHRSEVVDVDFLPHGGTVQGEQASQELHEKVAVKRRATLARKVPSARIGADTYSQLVLPDVAAEMVSMPEAGGLMAGGLKHPAGMGTHGTGRGPGMNGHAAALNVALPPSMSARCGAAERLEKLRQNGGSSECEAAVSRSLEWLKTKQNADGSWGASYKAAMTGLALLCYLGRCETPDSPFYGDSVMKGILYLVELARKNPRGFITEDLKGNAGAYEHGIATYALGEMYALSRLGGKNLPGMREAFETGVKRILESQNETGGWDYYVRNVTNTGRARSTRDDLSVTGWQYQALKAALHTGLKVAGLQEAAAKTVKLLEKLQTGDGGIGSTNRDQPYNQWNLTGTGVLGLQSLGRGMGHAGIDRGIKFLRRFLDQEPLDWDRNCNLYCWYYYTQAFFQQGGEDWKLYNQQLLPQLLNHQNMDGSWKPERANSPVAAVNEKEGGIYKTTLYVLQLEVYYRYLKAGDREEKSVFER